MSPRFDCPATGRLPWARIARRRPTASPLCPATKESQDLQCRQSPTSPCLTSFTSLAGLPPGHNQPSQGRRVMRKARQSIGQFADDEDGAALVEYSVLLGVMLV